MSVCLPMRAGTTPSNATSFTSRSRPFRLANSPARSVSNPVCLPSSPMNENGGYPLAMTMWSFFSACARCQVVCCAPAVISESTEPTIAIVVATSPIALRRRLIADLPGVSCSEHLAEKRHRPGMPRPVEQPVRRAFLDDASLVHVHDAVGDLSREAHLM